MPVKLSYPTMKILLFKLCTLCCLSLNFLDSLYFLFFNLSLPIIYFKPKNLWKSNYWVIFLDVCSLWLWVQVHVVAWAENLLSEHSWSANTLELCSHPFWAPALFVLGNIFYPDKIDEITSFCIKTFWSDKLKYWAVVNWCLNDSFMF